MGQGLPGYKGKIMVGTNVVSEMASWSVSGMETEMLEDTVLGDDIKTYVPGRIDGGTVTVTGQYDPSAEASNAQNALWTAFTTQTAVAEDMTFYYSATGNFGISTGGEIFVESITDFGVDQSGLGTIGFVLRLSGGYLEKKA